MLTEDNQVILRTETISELISVKDDGEIRDDRDMEINDCSVATHGFAPAK
jgi:hypothetical protein